MSAAPDVSVCIINWNGREILRQCLGSLRAGLNGVGVEVIVVDNASTDDSAQVVSAAFPGAVLIQNDTNRGFAVANNQAAARATGRCLLFLNNDTIVAPGELGGLVRFLDSHPDVVAVGPQLIGQDGLPQRTGRNLPTLGALLHRNVLPVHWTHLFAGQYRDYRHTYDPAQSGPVPQLAAAALMVRRDAFTKSGGWDERFEFGVEDVDFCQRLAGLGTIYYLAEVKITHLGRVSSHLNRFWVFRSYQCGYVRYFRKYHRHRWVPLVYKIGVTLDTPIRFFTALARSGLSLIMGHRDKARQSSEKAAALWFFLTRGLIRFWAA